MKLKEIKLDADGRAIMEDGLPIYVYEDGSESPFDAVSTVGGLNDKVIDLEEGNAKQKVVNTKLRDEAKPYKGLDPKKAREALETVASLSSKEILDTSGVKLLKEEMRSSFSDEKKGILKTHKTELSDRDALILTKESTIKHLMVSSEFAKSEFFSGEKPKTIYPPDDAVRIFGGRFVVEGEGAEARIVGKDLAGNPIMSKKNHGDIANFNEAMTVIIEEHPNKARITAVSPGGPGAFGNLGDGQPLGDDAAGVDLIKSGLRKHQASQPTG